MSVMIRAAVRLFLIAGIATTAQAQTSERLDQLATYSSEQLMALFDQSSAGTMPQGAVRGQAIVLPGSSLAVPASRGSRLYWQGKVFDPASQTAINRFFGLPMIKSQVSYAPSVRDGAPAILLDYSQTSWAYQYVRDEIREVSPGLYLGMMYRTKGGTTFRRYFAFEDTGTR